MIARLGLLIRDLDAARGPGTAAREACWLTFIVFAAPLVLLGIAIVAGD